MINNVSPYSKPGVYWDDKARADVKAGKVASFKARGISAKDLSGHIEQIDFMFYDYVIESERWPQVRFPVSFAVISALQALMRNDWSLAGTVFPNAVAVQSSNPKTKRYGQYDDDGLIRSKPRRNDPYEPSHPYEKRFGMDDPFSDDMAESLGITPDGYVGQMFREGIGI